MIITKTEALDLIQRGELIGIQTDTVYGLACNYQNKKAVNKLYSFKNRPFYKPLVLQLSNKKSVEEFLLKIPIGFNTLAKLFWPGALTLVLPIKQNMILKEIRASLPTQGFRVPDHSLSCDLIDLAGPLVVTSLNISSQKSLITLEEVEEVFGKDFPIYGENLQVRGIESTILSYEGDNWQILRMGAISYDEIKQAIDNVVV